ncbi:hypothetical protein R1sor_006678 [Riccia sorocarpa]|uniref:Uncharacterized protein n=1 Tax=Riccia sorocarpa TaxID=122646 RepID=A0ABD3HRQ9_9MARC
MRSEESYFMLVHRRHVDELSQWFTILQLVHILENKFAKAILVEESSSQLSITSPVLYDCLEAGPKPATMELSAIFRATTSFPFSLATFKVFRGLEAGPKPATIELSAIFRAITSFPFSLATFKVVGVLDAKLALLGDAILKLILIPILRDPLVVSTTDVTNSCPNLIKSVSEDTVIRFLHKYVLGDHAKWMASSGVPSQRRLFPGV